MIPLKLTLSGFLSYRELVDLDFTSFDLACIAGPNGAGKSSLLDAITWTLFGYARKRDDSIINAQSNAAEVCLIFAYESNIYRVQRALPRDKTTLLEFQIWQGDTSLALSPGVDLDEALATAPWRTLTESAVRQTQARIEQVLRLDYETFVNAAFFLQGKADQFTQQRPSDRKRILGSILGLEVWEVYRQRAMDRRKVLDQEIASLDGRLAEINSELAEEDTRRERLSRLQAELVRLSEQRAMQENLLETLHKLAASLEERRRYVASQARLAEAARERLNLLEVRLKDRSEERDSYANMMAHADEVDAAYAAWQQARKDLECWDEVASRFHEQEKRRQDPLSEINAERARLAEAVQTLQNQEQLTWSACQQVTELEAQRVEKAALLAEAEQRLERRDELSDELKTAQQRLFDARAENPRLKREMDDLKIQIDTLTGRDQCPTCEQDLEGEIKESLLSRLGERGRDMGDRYRANSALLKDADALVGSLEMQIATLNRAEQEARLLAQSLAALDSRLDVLHAQVKAWEIEGAPRLESLRGSLSSESFAPEARQRLAAIDAELKETGYDAASHDAARRTELQGRQAENDLRTLERARATLAPLEREIAELIAQAEAARLETLDAEKEHQNAAVDLARDESQTPDLYAAENQLYAMQEAENQLRAQVGAALQSVSVLADQKARKKDLERQREGQARQVSQLKQLERAFSKDGVPALLIEQALPEIEDKANEILERLSGGNMSVRFITQAAYKDKKREDMRETLDIQISDGAGMRDLEMFSGGEAFRVNFAIRLALSKVLAQRAGARLKTLVVDEGFGSQDAEGRQRLIEAINLVRPDFAKILVITHIDELKDAFPNRVEVEKTPQGSIVKVI